MIARAQIVAAAEDWLGTPYHHQESTRLVGCDCLGLVRGVWRAVIGLEPAGLPPYSPDWGEGAPGQEDLLTVGNRFLSPAEGHPPGSVLIFRMKPGAPAKHCGIVVPGGKMIHAHQGRSCCHATLGSWWMRKVVGTFDFPGVTDG